MKKLLFLATGALIFLLFTAFSYLVHKDLLTQFDFDTTVRLQDNLPRRVDGYFSTLSEFGNFEFLLIVLVILLLVFRKFKGGLFVIFSFVVFHVIEIYGKTFVSHPPPPEFMLRIEKFLEFPQFHVRNEFSYPSGHAGRTAFISAILFYLVGKSKRIKPIHKVIIWSIIIGFDMLMFVSRVYLGEHWSSDVIGGALLGFALGIIAFIFL
ncbi:MAG: phosphatase PAP2 family protein [Candidatus Levyibacteriota bacterium]